MDKNKEKNNRIAVFADGSNFYFKMRSLGLANLLDFNFRQFCNKLSRERKIVYCGYYVGVVRAKSNNKKGQILRLAQRKLFNFLISPKQGFEIKKGYLMKNDGVYHEKGVDVQLAVDILVGAYEDTYDTAIIISSDTDLIPAIEKVKQLGKEIEYIGFSHQPSFAMEKFATLSRLLIKEDLEEFVNTGVNKKAPNADKTV